MADPIRTIAIDSTQWFSITTVSVCRTVEIQESQLLATANYLVRRPGSATPVTRAGGTPFIFRPRFGLQGEYFSVGDVVAEIQTAPGTSMVFDIVEN